MNFNSYQFLLFFPIVNLFFFLTPKKCKNLWLLAASWFFYACWDVRFLLLLIIVTVVSYVTGIVMEQTRKKKRVLLIGLICLFGILIYFKYRFFVIHNLVRILKLVGIVTTVQPMHSLILPVGISFYTFQATGYLIDVYRDGIRAERRFVDYALYIAFFPQLVAGPIERAEKILEQLKKDRTFVYERFREGILILLWGYFLKLVLADRIAIFVDTVYADYGITYPGFYMVVATVLFSIQIYCDFYGYSTIAIGTAKMLGIDLVENFNAPYLSTNVAEFWRNWHISLTSWFRDYLYIPLGGGRWGKAQKYWNTMAVFLVSGLWHGASFAFVAWGGINGFCQIIADLVKPIWQKPNGYFGIQKKSLCNRVLAVLVTNVQIDFAWLFFRARGMSAALQCLRSWKRIWNPWILFDGESLYKCGLNRANFMLMLVCIGILLCADLCKRKGIVIRNVILEQSSWFRILFIPACLMFILIFGVWGVNYDISAFIYFQF